MARQFRDGSPTQNSNSSPKRKAGWLCDALCAVGLTIVLVFFWTSDFFWKLDKCLLWASVHLFDATWSAILDLGADLKTFFLGKVENFLETVMRQFETQSSIDTGDKRSFLGTNLKQKEKLENLLCRLWADRADPTDKDTELSLSPHFGFSLFSLCQV